MWRRAAGAGGGPGAQNEWSCAWVVLAGVGEKLVQTPTDEGADTDGVTETDTEEAETENEKEKERGCAPARRGYHHVEHEPRKAELRA